MRTSASAAQANRRTPASFRPPPRPSPAVVSPRRRQRGQGITTRQEAATASADGGRSAGSVSRQPGTVRSMEPCRSATKVDGAGGLSCGAPVGLSAEGGASGEQLEEHEAQRIQIAADRQRLAHALLGGHVGGRSRDRAATGLAGRDGETEVRQPRPPPSVDHHVRGLEVAVEDSARVRGGEPGADLSRDLEALVPGQMADAAEQGSEVLAVHVLHGEEVLAVHFAHVVHATHVRVRDLAGQPRLCEQARELRGVGGHGPREELQRHDLAELEVVGAVHLAHASLADQGHDAIPVRHHDAGRESGGVGVARAQHRRGRRRGTGRELRAHGRGTWKPWRLYSGGRHRLQAVFAFGRRMVGGSSAGWGNRGSAGSPGRVPNGTCTPHRPCP